MAIGLATWFCSGPLTTRPNRCLRLPKHRDCNAALDVDNHAVLVQGDKPGRVSATSGNFELAWCSHGPISVREGSENIQMARYLDSGASDSPCALGNWIETNFTTEVVGFRCQFGYYGYRALYPFEELVRGLVEASRPVHLVLGSNKAALIQSHLEWTLELVQGSANSSLTVIAFGNAEFHPKTIHFERQDGSSAAVVGSANLTEAGLGLNVEAGISLDTREGDDPKILKEIAQAIDRWRSLATVGVFPIGELDDIQALKDAEIIDEPQPAAPRPGGGTARNGDSGPRVGKRQRLWTPNKRPPAPGRPAAPPVMPGGQSQAGATASTSSSSPSNPGPPVTPSVSAMRWCKQMKSSDAQWVSQGTNPTGKLRLAQAGFPIDHRRYFRYQLFGSQMWSSTSRSGKTYDVAPVPFDVTVRGNHLGTINLVIDHAPHREADQNNVPTVLAWGTILNRTLTGSSHVNDWVIIERDTSGNFKLTIQSGKPSWAP